MHDLQLETLHHKPIVIVAVVFVAVAIVVACAVVGSVAVCRNIKSTIAAAVAVIAISFLGARK